MGCARALAVDLADLLQDRAAAEWEALEKHSRSCAECASRIAVELALLGGLWEGRSHPSDDVMLQLVQDRSRLQGRERASAEEHLRICSECRTALRAFSKLDLPGLVAEINGAGSTPRAEPRQHRGRAPAPRSATGRVWLTARRTWIASGLAAAAAIALVVLNGEGPQALRMPTSGSSASPSGGTSSGRTLSAPDSSFDLPPEPSLALVQEGVGRLRLSGVETRVRSNELRGFGSVQLVGAGLPDEARHVRITNLAGAEGSARELESGQLDPSTLPSGRYRIEFRVDPTQDEPLAAFVLSVE